MSKIRTRPTDVTGMPGGIPYIISNEAAERFSFYGMKAALAVFLANYLGVLGGSDMSEAKTTSYVAFFTLAVYFTPLFGALIADTFFGKYRTIITLSIVYCLGHLCLAFMGVGGIVTLGASRETQFLDTQHPPRTPPARANPTWPGVRKHSPEDSDPPKTKGGVADPSIF